MPKGPAPELSFVVPSYNEAASLAELAGEIAQAANRTGRSCEVIFVDDGSTDETPQVLEGLCREQPLFQAITLPYNQGKAAALAAGFEQSKGEVVITMDADLQDDPANLPALLSKLDNGFDLACGWKKPRLDPLSRRISSFLFNWITSWLFGPRLHDHNCGFKAYKRAVIQAISLYGELHRFATFLAHSLGFRVCETVVSHRPRQHGKSRYGMERIWRSLFDLFTVTLITRPKKRIFRFFAGMGSPLSILGLALCGGLFLLPPEQAAHHMPLFLSGILALLVGIQFFAAGLLGEFILSLWWLVYPKPGTQADDSPAFTWHPRPYPESGSSEVPSESQGKPQAEDKPENALLLAPDGRSCFGPPTLLQGFPGTPQSLAELSVWCRAAGIPIRQARENGETIPCKPSLFQQLRHLPLFFVARYHARPLHFFGLWGGAATVLGVAAGVAVKLSPLAGIHRYFCMALCLGVSVAGIQLFAAGLLGELLAYLRSFLIRQQTEDREH